MTVHPMRRTWDAHGATWNRSDVSERINWQSPGASGRGDIDPSVTAASQLESNFLRGERLVWMRFDITEVVRQWTEEGGNFGLLIQAHAAEQSGALGKKKYLRVHPMTDSHFNRDSQLRPRIVLTIDPR